MCFGPKLDSSEFIFYASKQFVFLWQRKFYFGSFWIIIRMKNGAAAITHLSIDLVMILAHKMSSFLHFAQCYRMVNLRNLKNTNYSRCFCWFGEYLHSNNSRIGKKSSSKFPEKNLIIVPQIDYLEALCSISNFYNCALENNMVVWTYFISWFHMTILKFEETFLSFLKKKKHFFKTFMLVSWRMKIILILFVFMERRLVRGIFLNILLLWRFITKYLVEWDKLIFCLSKYMNRSTIQKCLFGIF